MNVLERPAGRLLLVGSALALIPVIAACGGKTGQPGGSGPGTTHATGGVDDLDVPPGGDGSLADAGVDAMVEVAPVTFVLKNTAEEDLVFSMDKGWQPNIFAYSGQPPNAKPILMFPKHCTDACDAEVPCPVCEEPTNRKEVKAAEKREVVAPGMSLEVPWDAQVFVYQKGPERGCECHTVEPVPEAEYTVKACGLRVTKTHERASTYQCVESTMIFPSEEPQLIELEFPTPPAPGKKKKK